MSDHYTRVESKLNLPDPNSSASSNSPASPMVKVDDTENSDMIRERVTHRERRKRVKIVTRDMLGVTDLTRYHATWHLTFTNFHHLRSPSAPNAPWFTKATIQRLLMRTRMVLLCRYVRLPR
ncbi:hypothetical protein Ahy_B04g069764 isoform A [Arachis hypogaea]|uniref:Uncharacterized protein n=1 Tax=Arachis hypogaea TaxID=3818 RepID=A0A444ZDN3_ARAHY|nr:hypothetical protein Ahy_B04g069764 isoform A [Arachis hypogaea]